MLAFSDAQVVQHSWYQGVMLCRKLKMPEIMHHNCEAAYGINTGVRTRSVTVL